MVILTDKYLAADFVKEITDKTFEVVESGIQTPMKMRDGQEEEKLILPIKFSTGVKHLWIPNATSQKALRKRWGDDTEKWIGKKATFEVTKQNVMGEMKDVIYIEDNKED